MTISPPTQISFNDLPAAAVLADELVDLRNRIAYFRSAETTSLKVEVTVNPVAELDFAELDSTTEATAAETIRVIVIAVLEQQEMEVQQRLAQLGVIVGG